MLCRTALYYRRDKTSYPLEDREQVTRRVFLQLLISSLS